MPNELPARRSRTAGMRSLPGALTVLFVAVLVVVAAVLLAAQPGPTGTSGVVGSSPTASVAPAGGSGTVTPTADPTDPGRPTDAWPTDAPSPTPRLAKDPLATSLPPDQLTGYVWPLRNARITSRYAPRDFGGFVMLDGKEMHDGLDLATHCGNKIRAAHDGTVLYAGRNFDMFLGYWGKPERIYSRLEQQGRVKTLPIVIVIDDGNGYRSVYVHLSKASVKAGDVVSAGDVIGLEGATGYATGCHLHYGLIRMDGPWQEVVPQLARYGYPAYVRQRVDPLDVLPWDDRYAPKRLRDRAAGASTASPAPTPVP